MSDPMSDPRMSDPRDYRRPEYLRDSGSINAVWGWVAAAAFVAAVLLFVFASNNNTQQTAAPNLNPPSQTTGAAPSTPGPTTPAPAPGGTSR